LPDKNGDDTWALPLPAPYVIDADGTIAFAFLDVDYRHRLEPADIIATLQSLKQKERVHG
jgi:peroxiredoxin